MPTPKPSRAVLSASPRTILGRKVKKLRTDGFLPANIFGKKIKSKPVSVSYLEFSKLFRKAGETALIDLKIEKEEKLRPVLITNVSRHPVAGNYLHADFHQVNLTEKVAAEIPLKVIGVSPAVKDKGAVLVVVLSEIEVKALPADLPDHIEVNIGKLIEFGDSILIKDLKIPAAVELLAEPEETVVTIQQPKQEVEEKPSPPADLPAEASAEAGGKAPEGEAPAKEGEKAQSPEKQ